MWYRDWPPTRQDFLGSPEGRAVYDRVEVARLLQAPFRHHNSPGIKRIPDQVPERLRGKLLAVSGPQTQSRDLPQDVDFPIQPGGHKLKRFLNERRHQWIGDHRRRTVSPGSGVAQGRLKGPSTVFESGLHAGLGALRSYVVVELRNGSQDALHELAGRGIVYRLRHRSEAGSVLIQNVTQGEVVVLLPSEPIEGVHDDEVHRLVAAKVHEILELRPIQALGGFAFLGEDLDHGPTLSTTVVLALSPLGL